MAIKTLSPHHNHKIGELSRSQKVTIKCQNAFHAAESLIPVDSKPSHVRHRAFSPSTLPLSIAHLHHALAPQDKQAGPTRAELTAAYTEIAGYAPGLQEGEVTARHREAVSKLRAELDKPAHACDPMTLVRLAARGPADFLMEELLRVPPYLDPAELQSRLIERIGIERIPVRLLREIVLVPRIHALSENAKAITDWVVNAKLIDLPTPTRTSQNQEGTEVIRLRSTLSPKQLQKLARLQLNRDSVALYRTAVNTLIDIGELSYLKDRMGSNWSALLPFIVGAAMSGKLEGYPPPPDPLATGPTPDFDAMGVQGWAIWLGDVIPNEQGGIKSIEVISLDAKVTITPDEKQWTVQLPEGRSVPLTHRMRNLMSFALVQPTNPTLIAGPITSDHQTDARRGMTIDRMYQSGGTYISADGRRKLWIRHAGPDTFMWLYIDGMRGMPRRLTKDEIENLPTPEDFHR